MQTKQHLFESANRGSIHFIQLCWLPLLAALALVGCKHEATGSAEPQASAASRSNPVGIYSLVTVDGKNVPCTVQHDGHTMTITSGSFSINADGTCISKIFLDGRARPMEVSATYTQADAKLTMQWQGAGTTIGTLHGETFTMNNEGMVFAYRK